MNKKNSMQDIRPRQHRRSIQDISIADVGREELHGKKTKSKKVIRIETDEYTPINLKDNFVPPAEYFSHSHNKPRWGMVTVWFFAIIILFGAGVFVSSFFHSAKVDIKIKEAVAEVNTTLNLSKKDTSNNVPFEIMSLSKEVSEAVPTNGEKQVSNKAMGRVVIYNKNTSSQKLIAQTRLQAPNGKIYRLDTTVTIAGAKKSGASLVPGSLEVNAVADSAGPEYNSSLVDLTFPAFKDTAKYKTVYAMSKTPFVGGSSGLVKIAKKEDLDSVGVKIKNELQKQLLSNLDQQVPDSFVLLPNIYNINFATTTQETKDNALLLKQKAEMVGVLVDSKKLSNFLAKNSVPGYSGEDIFVDNLKELTYEYSTSTLNLNVNTNNLTLKISGKPHFVYGYDGQKLKSDLVGISRDSFASIIATYPGIERGNSTIEPFWRSKFPTDLAKITINEEK